MKSLADQRVKKTQNILLGKAMANHLLFSLQVDSAKHRDLLGWKPVITMDEQLRKMAEADSAEG